MPCCSVARTPSLRPGQKKTIASRRYQPLSRLRGGGGACHSKQFFIGVSKEPIVRSISCIDPGDKVFIEFAQASRVSPYEVQSVLARSLGKSNVRARGSLRRLMYQ